MKKFLLLLLAVFLGYTVAYYTQKSGNEKSGWGFNFKSTSNNKESFSLWNTLESMFSSKPKQYKFQILNDSIAYEQAKFLYKKENWQDAFTKFNDLATNVPDFDSIYLYAGKSAIELQYFDSAQQNLLIALELNSKNVEANTLYANLLNEHFYDYYGAADYAKLALKYDKTYLPAYDEYAKANYYQADYDETNTIIDKALNIDSSYAPLYYLRGKINEKWNDTLSAIEYFNLAIHFDSSFVKPYDALANIYFYESNYPVSISWYRQAINKKSNDKYMYYLNAGLDYWYLENLDSCLYFYNKSIEAKNDYYLVYNNIGYVYYTQKKYDLALENYSKCVEINSKYANVYLNRGVLYYTQQKYMEALNDFYSAHENDPDDNIAVYDIAITQDVLENYEDACKMYEKYLETGTNPSDIAYAKERLEQLSQFNK
jgi:tetratricopeptide (TPR) repeat protein